MQYPLGSVPKPPAPPKKSGRRRVLLLVVVLAGLVFGTVHIVYGSGAKSPARHHPRRTACATTRLHHHVARVTCAASHRRKTRHVHRTALQSYAHGLVAVLRRTRAAFDGAAAAVGNAGPDSVDSVCNSYGTQITILESMADGVPHPGAWYQSVSSLHRNLLGLYHDILGGLQDCQTGAENGDFGTVGVATSDIQNADVSLRQLDDYVVRVAR